MLFCNNAAAHTGACKQPTRLPGPLGERIIRETRVGGRRRGIEQLVLPAQQQNGELHARRWRKSSEEGKREGEARKKERDKKIETRVCEYGIITQPTIGHCCHANH